MLDAATLERLSSAKVSRLATRSSRGRPSVNPLYFVVRDQRIWLGTPEWTLAARNVLADARVLLLFDSDGSSGDEWIVRVGGRARVLRDAATLRQYNVAVARKYVLSARWFRSAVTHPRQRALRRHYRRQSTARGAPAVIEVVPAHAEWLTGDGLPVDRRH